MAVSPSHLPGVWPSKPEPQHSAPTLCSRHANKHFRLGSAGQRWSLWWILFILSSQHLLLAAFPSEVPKHPSPCPQGSFWVGGNVLLQCSLPEVEVPVPMPFFLFYTDHLRTALWPETDAVSYKLECLTPTELHFRHTFAQSIVIFAANWARFAFQQRRKCQSKFVNATCPVELPLMIPMETESVILKTYYPSVNILLSFNWF